MKIPSGKAILAESQRIQHLVYERFVKDFILVALGVISATIGLKGFLLPNHFIDGGVTGISLLLERITHLPLSLLIVLINLPFILMGIRQISWQFALKSTIAIFVLAILVYIIHLPVITDDKLLIAVFGGFFLGAGIGLAIRGGSVIDGTEILAIYVSKRTTLTVGDFISVFNVALFLAATFIIHVEAALYSMLTYFAASRTIDFIINGIEQYIGVTIVSLKHEEVKEAIINKLGRGVTVYKSESGFNKAGTQDTERKVLFCVVTRLEVTQLLLEIEKIDEQAFVIQHNIKETKGGMIKRRPFH